jgi:hypothetical protein
MEHGVDARHAVVHREGPHPPEVPLRQLTFALLYAFHENFVLPFSHDEVVHLKRSMLDKMPGDLWRKFANLRLLYSYMYAPGQEAPVHGRRDRAVGGMNHDHSLQWACCDGTATGACSGSSAT